MLYNLSHMKTERPRSHPEMIEGPEAFDRFQEAIKAILKVPKSSLPPSPLPSQSRLPLKANRSALSAFLASPFLATLKDAHHCNLIVRASPGNTPSLDVGVHVASLTADESLIGLDFTRSIFSNDPSCRAKRIR